MDAAAALRHIAVRSFLDVVDYAQRVYGIDDDTALISYADESVGELGKYTIIIEGNNVRFVDVYRNYTITFQLTELIAK